MTVCTDRHIHGSWVHMGQDRYIGLDRSSCVHSTVAGDAVYMSCSPVRTQGCISLLLKIYNITDDH